MSILRATPTTAAGNGNGNGNGHTEFVPLLGVPIARVDYESTLDWIDHTIDERGKGFVCVAAVHTVMATQEDPDLAAAVQAASLVVPDGQPVVWALNALGRPLEDRVYGPELMLRSCSRAADRGIRIYLYGGRNRGVLVQLTENLRRQFPGLQVVGGYSPPFRDLDEAELDAIAREINRTRPDVVWVGIGVPKQEKWMAAMRERLDAPVLVGVGQAFDLHAGTIPQAPEWMQKLGMEWLFRLSREPRRLWRRYVRYNPRFIAGFARQWARERSRPAPG